MADMPLTGNDSSQSVQHVALTYKRQHNEIHC